MSLLSRRSQLAANLNQFYNKPVAMVSMELFLTILAVVFFAIFAIRPTLLTMSELIKELEDKRKLDVALAQKIASLSTAQSEYLNVQDELPLLDEAIPNQPELISALKIIEKLAAENRLAISAITVSEIPEETPTEIKLSQLKRLGVPMVISVSGDYPSIRQFVEDLRQIRRTFVIDTVSFSTSDEFGRRSLRASISLNLPYFGSSTNPNENKSGETTKTSK